MAKHDVRFDIPLRPVGNADVRFVVIRSGKKFGELHVSKGAVVWVGKDKTYGRRLGWKQLSTLFETSGAKRKP